MNDICDFKCPDISLENILSRKYIEAVKIAYQFLMESSIEKLRKMVGKKLDFIPDFEQVDKMTFVESYQKPIKDDILAGYKLFKVTENKELQIDWTGGHYQLPLGYHYPIFDDLIIKARKLGIVDDTHNNTPGMPVKLLARELIKCANAYDDIGIDNIIKSEDRLNRVTSVDTGTVAASTGIKSILYRFRDLYKDKIPVFIMQEGNYHGTDFFEQRLRGMWEWLFANVIIEFVKPNDIDSLLSAFLKYENTPNEKVCTVMMEPVLMNNRAIYLQPDYVQKAKELCDQYDAVLFLDEIQTSMWSPKVFMSNEYGGVADVLAIGKGLTAGYSPLAYTICKSELDNQSQYSSISTNGNADMAALAGLIVLAIVKANSEHIEQVGNYYFSELENFQKSYPDKITEITGLRHLAGINLADESLASKFHHACLENGIFVRLQAYKEGASTIITKPPIIANFEDVDFVIDKFRKSIDSI
ncbi:TPA: aminotransferase class III-fold pyridoxal phosphate-dependent enzyme [Candidatus Poribacteria bacterium]|nr:aminotransferase class III-fold pyridoxal phosphate-dependent enzyme [Candidatus Poribacteria bacterium]